MKVRNPTTNVFCFIKKQKKLKVMCFYYSVRGDFLETVERKDREREKAGKGVKNRRNNLLRREVQKEKANVAANEEKKIVSLKNESFFSVV